MRTSPPAVSLLDIARRVRREGGRDTLRTLQDSVTRLVGTVGPAASAMAGSAAFAWALGHSGEPHAAVAALPAVTAALAMAHASARDRRAEGREGVRQRLTRTADAHPIARAALTGAAIGGGLGALSGEPSVVALNAAVGAFVAAGLAPAPRAAPPRR